MPSYSVTVTSQTTSGVLPLDLKRYSSGVGLLLTITGTLTCTVQLTGDNLQQRGYTPATGNWNNHDTLIDRTASTNGNLSFPVTGVRLNVTAYTNGSAVLTVIQAEG